MLISPLNAFPWVVNGMVQAWVSLKRLQLYLNLENLNWLTYYAFNEIDMTRNSVCIEIRNGEFNWKTELEEEEEVVPNETLDEENALVSASVEPRRKGYILKNINLKIKRGQLIGLIGKVGSGKSSFLHTLMAEIDKINGKVRIDPGLLSNGFAYVGQESWIKATSIKENILFGSPMIADLYERVIDACALAPDLELLPYGDETLVGENGVCLSGGQKARLALARACYAMDKEVFLLDDPFSAVDAHTATHLNNSCINELLASKTRIICTHHYKYLTNADLVLVIYDGMIIESGRGQDIIANMPNYIKTLNLSEHMNDADDLSAKENLLVNELKSVPSKENLKDTIG